MTVAYREALESAWTALSGKDIEALAHGSGGATGDGGIVVEVLGRRCLVAPSDRSLSIDNAPAGTVEAILVLHYIANAAGTEPSGELVSYRQLPGGNVYYPAFKSRVADVIGGMYHRDPPAVAKAMIGMRASRVRQGDDSFVVKVFPKLPVTIILWRGDEEVPSSSIVLFDGTAPLLLDAEELAAAGAMIVDRLSASMP
jgi:hypothetical protein